MNCDDIFLSNTRLREIEDFYQKKNIRLMGIAAANLAKRIIKIIKGERFNPKKNPILIIAGKGNNGGDAIELASIFLKQKYLIEVIAITSSKGLSSEDYQIAKNKFGNAGGSFIQKINPKTKYSIIIDGIFGIGFSSDRKIPKSELEWINFINTYSQKNKNCRVIAIDISSGLDAKNGNVVNINHVVYADYTISLIAHKAGMFMNFGPTYSGKIILDTLAIEKQHPEFYDHPKKLSGGLINTPKIWQKYLPTRTSNFHKGNAGSVVVFGGLKPMIGAGHLASLAALKLGCGRVYWENQEYAIPEVINSTPDLKKENQKNTIILIGPGLGKDQKAKKILTFGLLQNLKMIIDADALTLISKNQELKKIVLSRKADTIFTPHPLEAARLLNTNSNDIQNNRIESASAISKQYQVYTILKGCGTILSTPGDKNDIFIQKGCSTALSTAGSGDVLAGAISSLLAQGSKSKEIKYLLLTAINIHLQAGLDLAKKHERGVMASELIDKMRIIYNRYSRNKN